MLTFNDDIQGTTGVILGALIGAIKASRGTMKEQQIVFYGAGAAAIGVADYLREALVASGLSEQESRSRIWIVNRGGVLRSDRSDLSPEQRVYAQPAERFASWAVPSGGRIDLETVIRNVRATILIGLSTAAGAFVESMVREMARKVERPIIFPLSNPTDRSVQQPYVFPAVGLGVVASGARRVKDKILIAAAECWAKILPRYRIRPRRYFRR